MSVNASKGAGAHVDASTTATQHLVETVLLPRALELAAAGGLDVEVEQVMFSARLLMTDGDDNYNVIYSPYYDFTFETHVRRRAPAISALWLWWFVLHQNLDAGALA